MSEREIEVFDPQARDFSGRYTLPSPSIVSLICAYIINKLPRGPLVGAETYLHKSWVPDLLVHQKGACSRTMCPKVPMETLKDKISSVTFSNISREGPHFEIRSRVFKLIITTSKPTRNDSLHLNLVWRHGQCLWREG